MTHDSTQDELFSHVLDMHRPQHLSIPLDFLDQEKRLESQGPGEKKFESGSQYFCTSVERESPNAR